MTQQKLTDQITDLIIDNYDVGSMDDQRGMYLADGGLNVKHNMGDKYLLGGYCNQGAYALNSAKKWLDSAELRHEQLLDANGPEDIKTIRAARDLSKAESKLANTHFFFSLFTQLFFTFTGVVWADGNVTDDHGVAWWIDYKEQMQGGNTDPVPTAKALKDRKAMLKARAADAQTAAGVQ